MNLLLHSWAPQHLPGWAPRRDDIAPVWCVTYALGERFASWLFIY